VTRIFPSYWLILGLIVMMMAAKHDPDLTAPHFLKSLFLIPDDQPPLLGVAWTLIFEMLFYAIFALGILNFRLGVAIALVWFLVVVSQAAAESQINYLRLFSSPRNLQFAMGIAAAYVVLKGSARAPLFLIAAGVCAFFVTGMVENAHVVGWDGIFSKLLFGFSSAIAIVGVALAERQGLLRFGKAGEFFGGTSYLLYLVHTLALGLCFHAIQIAGLYSFLPAEMAVLIGSAASVAVASILYIFFDKPVQGILRHFEKRYLFGANEASAAVSRTG
jgi:peptidoglycan/LPS O-acetylase OafA/YrhL